MSDVELKSLLGTFTVYDNKFRTGAFKNGNYDQVVVKIDEGGVYYDLNYIITDMPQLLEAPYFINKIWSPKIKAQYPTRPQIHIELIKKE